MEVDHPPLMICEYLGTKTEPGDAIPYPSKLNRCKAEGRLDRLPLEKQTDLCLGPGHLHCPLRLKARAKEFAPPLSAAEALPTEPQGPLPQESKGGMKRSGAQEDTRPVAKSEEYELNPVEFPEVPESDEPVPKPRRRAKKEPPSQPFRREMEDLLRSLFKDKRGQ